VYRYRFDRGHSILRSFFRRTYCSILIFFGWSLLFGSVALQTQFLPAEVVRVLILSGQSNIEGKAENKLLEHQAPIQRPATCSPIFDVTINGAYVTMCLSGF
jgi:hypothetical protein